MPTHSELPDKVKVGKGARGGRLGVTASDLSSICPWRQPVREIRHTPHRLPADVNRYLRRFSRDPQAARVRRSVAGRSGHHDVVSSLTNTRISVGRRGLVRPRRGKLVAGVAAGLAQRYGVSPTFVRVLFLVSMLLPGPQIVAYLALWIIMPKEGRI